MYKRQKDGNPNIYDGYAKEGVTVLFADPDTYKLTVKDGEIQYEALPSYRDSLSKYTVSDLVLKMCIRDRANINRHWRCWTPCCPTTPSCARWWRTSARRSRKTGRGRCTRGAATTGDGGSL